MKSLTGKFASARGWALLFTLFLGAGLFVAGCGEEDAPAPTTPAPTPPPPAPEPEPPAPEKPATPTGFQVASKTSNSITWTWNAVEGAHGYVVQTSADEAFDETDALNLTVQPSYTATGLAAETSVYARVAAGVMTSAAPSIDPKDYLLSDWTTHVTGTTDAVAPDLPPAPTNVRATDRGSDFIEWGWDAVAGVAGYRAEFSLSADFSDPQSFNLSADETSLKISNLDAETAGYLRVRSYTGSGTGEDTVLSEWSATGTASTKEPPPAVPLSAPTGVSTGATTEESIVVTWDEVDDAASYEVQQRVSGGDWVDATCAGGGNEVGTEECVATGLSKGTDYEFRVRAIPASADTDEFKTGGWSATLTAKTSGRAPADPVTGGMGNLNVTWESDDDSISWIWDRVDGAQYDIHAVAIAYNTDADPCKNAAYAQASGSSRTSFDLPVSTEATALLCVRTTNPQNLTENLSFSWAISAPTGSELSFTSRTESDADKDDNSDTTTALVWSGFSVIGGFNYEYRVAADPQGTSKITTTSPVQAACDAGIALKRDESDVSFDDNNIVLDRGLAKYTGYLLCTRYSNDAGESAWAVPNQNTKGYTRPARPPSPTVYSSFTSETDSTTTVAWRVATRGKAELPRLADKYNVRTIEHRERRDDPDDEGTKTLSNKAPTAKSCSDDQLDTAIYTRSDNLANSGATDPVTNDGEGIVIRPAAFGRPAADQADQPKLGNTKAYVCVQANDSATGAGPWVLSSSYTVKKQAAP